MKDDSYFGGMRLKATILAGINWFNFFEAEVDAINVFPVPDSDTGKNMHSTFLSISEYLKDADRRTTSDVARKCAEGAVLGARGCSGIIISGFFRGFAEGVGENNRLNSVDLANCFKLASEKAYQTVVSPKEGTILTVARDMANAALNKLDQNTSLAELIKSAYESAKESVQTTPSKLQILKRHGVVDAGGLGLVYFLEGMMRYNFGQSLRKRAKKKVVPLSTPIFRKRTIHLKFCTELILRSSRVERKSLQDLLTSLGDSLIISQIQTTDKKELIFKIHIHTNEPKSVLTRLSELGVISHTKINDMQKQYLDALKKRG